MRTRWKVIIGLLTAVLPSVFTYLAARSESNEAKIRAETAYEALQGTVKELQSASTKQALELAELRGELRTAHRNHTEPKLETPEAPPPKFRELPAFETAVQAYKAKR